MRPTPFRRITIAVLIAAVAPAIAAAATI